MCDKCSALQICFRLQASRALCVEPSVGMRLVARHVGESCTDEQDWAATWWAWCRKAQTQGSPPRPGAPLTWPPETGRARSCVQRTRSGHKATRRDIALSARTA